MRPNVLVAISNIADFRQSDLRAYAAKYVNRIAQLGEQLEYYVKDAVAGSFKLSQTNKEEKYRESFSWLGNQNNPPDFIVKGGDAYEIKKIQSNLKASLALNSSPPKDKLYRSDPRITNDCKKCEKNAWTHKDLFYVIGCTQKRKIRYLFFVHGLCYAAEKEVYDRIANPLKRSIEESIMAYGLEKGETRELGRINRVDPLGITSLRVRGMWQIQNPLRVFSHINEFDPERSFSLIALMLKSKFDSFPQDDVDTIRNNPKISLKDVKIRNPNNPAKMLDAELITTGW